MDTETIRDALSALSDETFEVTDRKRKYCRQMNNGRWYTFDQCVRYYGHHEFPREQFPHTIGAESSCRLISVNQRDLNFRLQYKFYQDHEEQETRHRLAEVTKRLEEELQLLGKRRDAAERQWKKAKTIIPETDIAKLDKCVWHWSRNPHPEEDRSQEDGMDWPYHENVYPNGPEDYDRFYDLDKWHPPVKTGKGGYIYPDLEASPDDTPGAKDHNCFYREAWKSVSPLLTFIDP